MHMLFLGYGYCAQAVHARLKPHGYQFSATYRTEAKRDYLASIGVSPVTMGDGQYTHALISIPPDDTIDPAFRAGVTAPWLGYFSTTGVYGDHGGAWVDETSELKAATPRTLLRVQAEAAWRTRGAHIFRLGGIYGLGRNMLEDAIHGESRCIDKPEHYFSRIHVEDIAGVVAASIQKPNPSSVYNVVDSHPSPSREVVEYAHQLLKLPAPNCIPFAEATLSPMAKEFYSANRKVRNTKLNSELAYSLLYPSYKEGLHAIYNQLKL
jgi:nucleoside-diphosphate-sugar epimerase